MGLESWREMVDQVIPERRGGRDGWMGHPADWERLYAMIAESFLCRQELVSSDVYAHIRGRLRDDWALDIAQVCERGYDLLEVARDRCGFRGPD